MMGISTIGPDPRIKVFVFAQGNSLQEIQDFISRSIPYEVIIYTPEDELNELSTLVKTRCVQAIIVADYPLMNEVKMGLIHPALEETRFLVIIKGYEEQGLAKEIATKYANKTLYTKKMFLVDYDKDFQRIFSWLNLDRRNIFGYKVGYTEYSYCVKMAAVLSFVLFFFGAASITSRIVEASLRSVQEGVIEAITQSVFLFIFTQIVFITCSSMLAMPLGLHYSKADITAVSLLGPFKSGSTVRLAFTALGATLGSVNSMRKGKIAIKIGRATVILILFGIAYLGIGLFIRSYAPWRSYIVYYRNTPIIRVWDIGEFLWRLFSQMGGFLGKPYSPSTPWMFSRGIAMHYIGLISIPILTKLKPDVRSVVLLVSILLFSWGFTRVTNMVVEQTVYSTLVGIVSSFFFIYVFLLIDRIVFFLSNKVSRR
jgi:hypothetical protein